MLEKYGLQSSVASGSYNIAREPLYFVRSGDINLGYGSARASSIIGYGWSNSAVIYASFNSATTYDLRFDTGATFPSAGPGTRSYGFPVRCLVY